MNLKGTLSFKIFFLSFLLLSFCNSAVRKDQNSPTVYNDSAQNRSQENIYSDISNGQQEGSLNMLDAMGRKMGLWIENNSLIEAYYSEGLRHGVFRHYSRKTGKLSAFGEFDKGIKSGTWYFFNEVSLLILKESGVKTNTRSLDRGNEITVTPAFRSIATFYHPNGVKSEEGELMYDDIELDYIKIGQWRYFDEDGTLIETKEHH